MVKKHDNARLNKLFSSLTLQNVVTLKDVAVTEGNATTPSALALSGWSLT